MLMVMVRSSLESLKLSSESTSFLDNNGECLWETVHAPWKHCILLLNYIFYMVQVNNFTYILPDLFACACDVKRCRAAIGRHLYTILNVLKPAQTLLLINL